MILHFFLCIVMLICSIMVLITKNPVHAVLYLISTFAFAAISVLMHEVEFIGLLFLIIYIGAIAILFLFVVMMLTVKAASPLNSVWLFLFIGVAFVSFCSIFYILKNFMFTRPLIDNFMEFPDFIDFNNMIHTFGQALFNYYLFLVLIGGLILLVAVIGAVVLTLEFKINEKKALAFRQLSRSNTTVRSNFNFLG